MGMGVLVTGAAMCRPAGVADAHNPYGLRAGDQLAQRGQLPLGLRNQKRAIGGDAGDTRRIVAAILKTLESIEQNGRGALRAHIPHDSTHRGCVSPIWLRQWSRLVPAVARR